MEPNDLKETLQAKMAELETALKEERSQPELLKIYKELKELQYRKVQAELEPQSPVVPE